MIGVLGLPTMGHRIGERADDIHELDDRSRPAVRHDQRTGVRLRRADMHEMDIHSVNLGQVMGILVERILAAFPVIAGPPVIDDGLDVIKRNALRPVIDRFRIGPAHMA